MESKWISRGECPCGESSRGYNIHADGHAFCFSCNKRFNNIGEAKMESKNGRHTRTECLALVSMVV